MRTNEILTPLDHLKETALDLVMANAPDLDIITSVKLTNAIAREILDAQKDAADRVINRVEAKLAERGLL
jgi:hypothetical protein